MGVTVSGTGVLGPQGPTWNSKWQGPAPLNSPSIVLAERELGHPVFLRLTLVWPSDVALTCHRKRRSAKAPRLDEVLL